MRWIEDQSSNHAGGAGLDKFSGRDEMLKRIRKQSKIMRGEMDWMDPQEG
jgi:hypothetical protein